MLQSSKIFWLGLVLLKCGLCLKTHKSKLSRNDRNEDILRRPGQYPYYYRNNYYTNYYTDPGPQIGNIKF